MEESQSLAIDPPVSIAHEFAAKPRTQDVFLDENTSFADLGLNPLLHSGLYQAGFEKPSPIQLSAIPYGRCGLDLVVQAKSGTGKTCVFTVVALEAIDLAVQSPQVLVLAPTREIALQIEQVISAIGAKMSGLFCHCSIGGLSLKEDMERVRRAHIVIGTPGRIKQLMELSALDCKTIRLFVLDEADKLMEDSFQEQINWIYSGLAESKQVIAASATYTEVLVQHLCNYMYNPTFIRLNSNDPVLIGVRQYKKLVPHSNLPVENYNNKVKALIDILSRTNYQQCLVFSNLMSRAENLSKLMLSKGWPTAHISGSQEQSERMEAITKLKTYNCRILVSTDLTARGIDADRIDLVINLDLPHDHETYLHRVGRAGRYGAKGAAVTIYTEEESTRLDEIAKIINTSISILPDDIREDFIQNPVTTDDCRKAVQVESFQIINNATDSTTRSMCSDSEVKTKYETFVSNGLHDPSPTPAHSNRKENGKSHAHDDTDNYNSNGLPEDSGNFQLKPARKNKTKRVDSMSAEPIQQIVTSTDFVPETTAESAVFVKRASKTDSIKKQTKLEVVRHRPPFQSLGEALQFLQDPHQHKDMLATTEYMTSLSLVDEKRTDSDIKSTSSLSYFLMPDNVNDQKEDTSLSKDERKFLEAKNLNRAKVKPKAKEHAGKSTTSAAESQPSDGGKKSWRNSRLVDSQTQTDSMEPTEQHYQGFDQDQYYDWYNNYSWYYNDEGEVEYYTEQDMWNWYNYGGYHSNRDYHCIRKPSDTTAERFHLHYRNSYLQHVYITSMSRKYST